MKYIRAQNGEVASISRLIPPQSRAIYHVTRMDVTHDDDCAIYLGRGCSCKPDISFVKGGKRFYLMKNGEKIYGTSLG